MGDECLPLKTLDELLRFDNTVKLKREPLRPKVKASGDEPRTLVCHDMMGGYLEDRFVEGSSDSDSYRFHHWHSVDTFVYFSHHFVTIPPPGWIDAAHKHGVQVLGTFITEWEGGSALLSEIREKQLVDQVARQLASVASTHGFDGWLMNIESALDEDCEPFLHKLLSKVTEESHATVPGSQVIWYDSILGNGKLDWQNELNDLNGGFFHLCDGIFLNYGWTEENLARSAQFAGHRKKDVYVGVDVYARNTKYAGGYDIYKAVETARKHGLSVAVFAPGWVFETQDRLQFSENQCRLWDFPEHCQSRGRFTTLPISSNFCQGFGRQKFQEGQVVGDAHWYNLSKQELQPVDQGRGLCHGHASATICIEDAFSGGGCLRLEYQPQEGAQEEPLPYFRLFECEIPLEDLEVSYTFKPESSSETDVDLILKLRLGTSECELLLGPGSPETPGGIFARRTHSRGSHRGWTTRSYLVRVTPGSSVAAVLQQVSLRFRERHQLQRCLLGRVCLQRPHMDSAKTPEASLTSA